MADDKKTEKKPPSKEVAKAADDFFNVVHAIEKAKPPEAK